MMMNLTDDRGSVLMEFIVVLPIYFLLLGTAFVIGELALHSVHLSASGDRSVAFAKNLDSDFWRELKQVMSLDRNAVANRDADAPDYSYAGDAVYQGDAYVSEFAENSEQEHRAIRPEHGFWTEVVAGRAKDNYTLSPLTRGFIAHWFYEIERRVYDDDLMAEQLERSEKDALDTILDKDAGQLGRVRMQGNYYKDDEGAVIRDYGYFSLRRTEIGRWENQEDEDMMPYRFWEPSALAEDNWRKAALNGGSVDSEYYEKLATVRLDGDLYVSEGQATGQELRHAKGNANAHDSGVEYDFEGIL